MPLSGGADSAAVAAIVASMARIILKEIEENPDHKTLGHLRRVVQDPDFTPKKY